MNRNCADLCPAAIECREIGVFLEATRNSMLEQAGLQLGLVDELGEAEILGALGVLGGEVTAEQLDALNRRVDAATTSMFGQSLSEVADKQAVRLPQLLETNRQARLTVDSLAGALVLAQTGCEGPKLGWRDRIHEKWQALMAGDYARGSRLPFMQEFIDESRQGRHNILLTQKGICASAAARTALEGALSDQGVVQARESLVVIRSKQ